jgi:hypothetical protein
VNLYRFQALIGFWFLGWLAILIVLVVVAAEDFGEVVPGAGDGLWVLLVGVGGQGWGSESEVIGMLKEIDLKWKIVEIVRMM